MELELRQKDVAVEPSLHDLIAGHVQSALGRFADRIRGVSVQLADTNGQRGGVDKHCGIAVRLNDGKVIRAHDHNTHVIAAFYFALDRVAYAVSRTFQRRRRHESRRRPWRLGTE